MVTTVRCLFYFSGLAIYAKIFIHALRVDPSGRQISIKIIRCPYTLCHSRLLGYYAELDAGTVSTACLDLVNLTYTKGIEIGPIRLFLEIPLFRGGKGRVRRTFSQQFRIEKKLEGIYYVQANAVGFRIVRSDLDKSPNCKNINKNNIT